MEEDVSSQPVNNSSTVVQNGNKSKDALMRVKIDMCTQGVSVEDDEDGSGFTVGGAPISKSFERISSFSNNHSRFHHEMSVLSNHYSQPIPRKHYSPFASQNNTDESMYHPSAFCDITGASSC
jgi:hypothetical protein